MLPMYHQKKRENDIVENIDLAVNGPTPPTKDPVAVQACKDSVDKTDAIVPAIVGAITNGVSSLSSGSPTQVVINAAMGAAAGGYCVLYGQDREVNRCIKKIPDQPVPPRQDVIYTPRRRYPKSDPSSRFGW